MIYFNVDEAREYLLKNGFVFTLRKPRAVGHTIAVVGPRFGWRKLGDVFVSLVWEKVETTGIIDLFARYSGLDCEGADWICKAWSLHKREVRPSLNLYRVDLKEKLYYERLKHS